jgi:hypothetical protein
MLDTMAMNDPMASVLQYVDAFNSGDPKAMAAACADPMQILDGMSPHVWQGPTASEDWWRDVLTVTYSPDLSVRVVPVVSRRGRRPDGSPNGYPGERVG